MKHKVLIGINYLPVGESEEVRREPGDEVSDLPPEDAPWLTEQGCVSPALRAESRGLSEEAPLIAQPPTRSTSQDSAHNPQPAARTQEEE